MLFEFEFISRHAPQLFGGMLVTFFCTLVAIVLAGIGGLAIGLVRARKTPILSGVFAVLVEVLRSTPFSAQLFLLYFGLPNVGIKLSGLTCGVLGLSLVGAALVSEVVRGGIAAVPPALTSAGSALGMNSLTIFRYIEIPIALRSIVRPLTGTAIQIFKESSILYLISVPEFLYTAVNLASVNFKEAEMIAVTGVFYLSGGLVIAGIGHLATRYLRLGRTT